MAERRITIVFVEEPGQPEQIKFEVRSISMDEVHDMLMRAEKNLYVSLIRNTIMRDLAELAEKQRRVILAGEGAIGVDIRRLRS